MFCNDETKSFLLDFGSVFEYIWIHAAQNKNCPENLMFYRQDNTVFINIVTHEGECYLYNSSEDELGDILEKTNWKKIN